MVGLNQNMLGSSIFKDTGLDEKVHWLWLLLYRNALLNSNENTWPYKGVS